MRKWSNIYSTTESPTYDLDEIVEAVAKVADILKVYWASETIPGDLSPLSEIDSEPRSFAIDLISHYRVGGYPDGRADPKLVAFDPRAETIKYVLAHGLPSIHKSPVR